MRWDDFEWAKAQLARFTYKPGWSWKLNPPEANGGPLWGPVLTVEFQALDAYGSGTTTTTVRSRQMIPPFVTDIRDEQHFALWLQSVLWEMERHESREWLRRDGEVFDDPHKEARSWTK